MSLQMYHLLQPTLSWSESHFVGPSNLHKTYINNYYRFLLNNFGRFNPQYIIYYQVKRFRLICHFVALVLASQQLLLLLLLWQN